MYPKCWCWKFPGGGPPRGFVMGGGSQTQKCYLAPFGGRIYDLYQARSKVPILGKVSWCTAPLGGPEIAGATSALEVGPASPWGQAEGKAGGSWRRFSSQDIFFLRGFKTGWDISMRYRNRILFDLGPRQRDKWWGKPTLLDDLASTSTSACFVLPTSLHVLNHNTRQKHNSDNVDPTYPRSSTTPYALRHIAHSTTFVACQQTY